MTSFSSKTRRCTVGEYSTLYAGKKRKIVVELTYKAGSDLLEFRELGCQEVFTLPVDFAFKIAIRGSV